MNTQRTSTAAAICLMAGMATAPAMAAPVSALMDMDQGTLRSELQSRYDRAVAAVADHSVQAASDSRFTWAVEAKNQCGIALGFLKSNTRDMNSINKCDAAIAHLTAPPPPPPPAAGPPAGCMTAPVVSIFFDWNMDNPLPEGTETINSIARDAASCGWTRFSVVGFTDTSGTNIYNDGLSVRRARNVASQLEQAGIASTAIATEGRGETQLKIETQDGVREPMNRRVEVTAMSGQ
ncbi:OmpA family protein [Sphingobium aquiterrae]|uniref:OmpA family protein n=1 Tax=Sphingobium aquiterrae TaxID=2038656 RepID=UPI00301AF853